MLMLKRENIFKNKFSGREKMNNNLKNKYINEM